jgi:uncharacterized protein
VAQEKFTNRLINETSPYLLQHAHNPVDWYPWGNEAFERARHEDKPLLLSVGYSACHWCHVMEHESFEDAAIAQLMNDNFVCIKVDREERPDIDQIYMNAVQLMTGHGGWPMTVFLNPAGVPFFGGTYFPPVDRHNMPGFPRVLIAVAESYRKRRDEMTESAQALMQELQTMNRFRPGDDKVSGEMLRKAYHQLASNFDSRHGGFGRAPKFPQPMNLNFLLRSYYRTKNQEALEMAETTLDCMARGGIYDHLAGGFARYSTDERWLVPHFEKMLYDNALLVSTYLAAYQISGNDYYQRIATETLDWVLAEMTDPQGGFYATLDADSEGEEGKFYVWEKAEIEALLGQDAAAFVAYYGVTTHGNFEASNILFVARPNPNWTTTVAQEQGLTVADLEALLARSRTTLRATRQQRIRPGRDEKILTAWCGLMIKAFAEAARILQRPDYLAVAVKATEFIWQNNWDGQQLRRSYKDGQSRFNAYLEDYAFMADGLLALYEASGEVHWLRKCQQLVDITLAEFWDPKESGFYFTANTHEPLIMRNKDVTDNAIPSGNSVAVDLLLRLYYIFGTDDYRAKAETVTNMLARVVERYPGGFGYLLAAIDFQLGNPQEIVIVGQPDAADTQALLRVVNRNYLPNKVLMVVTPDIVAANPDIPLLAGKEMVNGEATAYVCDNFVCRSPVTSPITLAGQLGIRN